MFGYVRVRKPELKIKEYDLYRRYYCGLCRSLKKNYGVSSELLLSYDLTFLKLLLTSVYDLKTTDYRSRCIAHPLRKQRRTESEADEYAASMSILLGYLHFEDDKADSGKAGASAMSFVYRKRAKAAMEAYPRQAGTLSAELKALHELEQEKSCDIESLSEHFGNALGEIFVWKDDIFAQDLRQMGFFLGKFIYVMDAVDDWEKDRKHGEFNPFSNESSKKAVLEKAKPVLYENISASAEAFEMLPAVDNVGILRNIIYAGVWNRFDKLTEELNESI
ncbi:MAG: hypothetical protein DUD27_01835 [Lachnospiraceae bacterium]|uniref:Uncharacterized protein n=1 Tax=Candidatus Weimeria bifida TaxID=2599074 RepID=A0A6N7IZG6_9FIRM|nr:hypothetical protein [Candidatus Weimeria bifida]RRF97010.1 MAG: hypothetical protein DUD27_01835 [Lachnospiraceae bacterium]